MKLVHGFYITDIKHDPNILIILFYEMSVFISNKPVLQNKTKTTQQIFPPQTV